MEDRAGEAGLVEVQTVHQGDLEQILNQRVEPLDPLENCRNQGFLIIGTLFDILGGNKVFYLSLVPMAIIFVAILALNRLSKPA